MRSSGWRSAVFAGLIVLLWPSSMSLFNQVERKELSAFAPVSMLAVNKTVEAKLKADTQAYARSLVELDSHRTLLSPTLVPSDEFIAAQLYMARAYYRVLDQKSDSFLERYEKTNTQKPLSTIAKQAADAEATFEGLYLGLTQYGSGQSKKELKRANVMWQGAIPLKDGGIVASAQGVRKLSDASKIIASAFDRVAVKERVFRNILVARFVWSSLALTWFFVPDVKDETLVTLLRTLQSLIAALPPVDKRLLSYLLEERLAAQLEAFDPAQALERRVALLLDLQRGEEMLCEAGDSAVALDVMLQSYRIAKFARQGLPNLEPVFERCLVGTKEYFAVSRLDGRETQTPLTVFLPRFAPSPSSLNATAKLIEGASTNPADLSWKSWFVANRVASDKNIGSYFRQLCPPKRQLIGLCLQLAYRRDGSERFLAALTKKYPQNKMDLLFTDAKQSLLFGDFTAYEEDLLEELGLEESYPEYSTLDWYLKNRSFFSKAR